MRGRARVWKRWGRPSSVVRRSEVYRAARDICAKLQRAGHEAFFVGGAVRDFHLRPTSVPKDIDIATDAMPERVREIFPRSPYVGKDFGVVLVSAPCADRRHGGADHGPPVFEVTTFRKEGTYSDRRHPDSVERGSRLDDSRRRDFTWNAMYFDPVSEHLWDPHDGRMDLRRHTIRAVGDPQERFHEDSLRILRLCRFSAGFGMSVEDVTRSAVRRATDGLAGLSAERIVAEFRKVRSGRFSDFMKILMRLIDLRELIPAVGSALESEGAFAHSPRDSGRALPPLMHVDMPLLSLVVWLASSSKDPGSTFGVVMRALGTWPLTRLENRLLRALASLGDTSRSRPLPPALLWQDLLERCLDLSTLVVAEIVRCATLLSNPGGEWLEFAVALRSLPCGKRSLRDVWKVACEAHLPEGHRRMIAEEVTGRNLPPVVIRMACANMELPALKRALGVDCSPSLSVRSAVDLAESMEIQTSRSS